MKPTFRQFLEDISVHDSAYDPGESHEAAMGMQRRLDKNPGSWKKLPIKFPVEGFEVWWVKHSGDTHICLIDIRKLDLPNKLPFGVNIGEFLQKDQRVAVDLNVSPWTPTIAGGGKLAGLITDVLSSSENYRGVGLAPMLYEALVRAGQVLFSSTTQTRGGQATWRKLVKAVVDVADVAALDSGYEAMEALKKFGGNQHNTELVRRLKGKDDKLVYAHVRDVKGENFIFTGSVKALDSVVYEHSSTHWVIAPRGTFDKYKQFTIHIDDKPVPLDSKLLKKEADPFHHRRNNRRSNW